MVHDVVFFFNEKCIISNAFCSLPLQSNQRLTTEVKRRPLHVECGRRTDRPLTMEVKRRPAHVECGRRLPWPIKLNKNQKQEDLTKLHSPSPFFSFVFRVTESITLTVSLLCSTQPR